MKRLVDIIISSFALIILFFPFLITSLLIMIDSEGPVFFMQERLGIGKKKFKVFKFRTMTHKDRTIKQVFKNDPEVTKLGKYLRRFKIDELPQIINVFKGDMSIVGPRPCVEFVAEKYSLCKERFMDKPGLSSLAGVSGSIFLNWEEKDYYDKYYYYNKSIFLDFKIIILTFLVVIFGEEKFLKKPII
ncbi:MAG: sugar transferase [Bacteroidia bacterium]|nr:sugar transferase [Bacteroidia bacterium]